MNIYFKLTWKSKVICFIIPVVMALILKPLLQLSIESFIIGIADFSTIDLVVAFFGLTIVLIILISIVHEYIHGVVYKLYGGKVKFGFNGIYAYTMETSGLSIERIKFLIIRLAPLMIIYILSLLLPSWLQGMLFLLNLFGSSRDIYMALFLTSLSYDSRIIDRSYGFDVVK